MADARAYSMSNHRDGLSAGRPLYTTQQRLRRDASGWTLVQGILAPIQLGLVRE